MKLGFLSFLLLMAINVLTAQKDFHTISLLPNKTESAENVDFYISGIVDNRVYKDHVGIAQKGMLNRKVQAQFEQPFEEELLAYLNTVFPPEASKKPLILRINQLLISENTGAFKETGTATVNLDVLIYLNNEYNYLGSFASEAEKNSMDVTGKHDDRIRAILKECLMEFDSLPNKYEAKKVVTLERPEVANILTESPGTGYYFSFNELYNNEPVQDTAVSIKPKDENLFRVEDAKGKPAPYYGFFDGTDFYLNAQNYSGDRHFVKAQKVNDFLLFNDIFINQDKVSGLGLAFGIIGVLASNERSNTLLDLNTGKFIVLTHKRVKLLLEKDYPEYYERYTKYENNPILVRGILEQVINEKGYEYIINTAI
ncbi:hypothetical protein [Flagellimonas iocasae]|uniref:DUF4136 domain-containing protein n=1 Tax=Flagellimonas iocasae TaxID=2055905 RepID=A0ABW4XTY2_9FLAO